ncbi:hypothetical protein LCGC14_1131620 [marine sediment metagenome]|uniref:Uncharacterized protein n=1 Tax=marine sediment metagenome TaxID=412755 RepID=A0A0F9PJ60_9ZZZZ
MRISPQQYFQGYEDPKSSYTLQTGGDHTLHFIIIGIIAGVALGLAIASLVKK